MGTLIGIVGKPYKGERWSYIQQVDEIREVLIKNGASVMGIVPNFLTIDKNYDIYPYYENYDLTDTSDMEKILDMCDGIILQGGGVISNYEQFIARYCLEKDIPILGICCGMLNLALVSGGSISYEKNEQKKESHLDLVNMYKHKVLIDKDSLLYKIINKEELITNSIHTGRLVDLGDSVCSARAEDGTVEAIEYKKNKFALGIQWHPELMYSFDDDQEKIFEYFIGVVSGMRD